MLTEQNFTYTSRASELGRGKKLWKDPSTIPEWTPGPGEYPHTENFVNCKTTKIVTKTTKEGETQDEVLEYTPWFQPGYSFGHGIRTQKKDDCYPAPSAYTMKNIVR